MSVNLARKEGCYAYELWKQIDKIEKMVTDKSVTLSKMKEFVHSCANKAKETRAQKNFIKNVNEKINKHGILYYCNNVIKKAELPLKRYY